MWHEALYIYIMIRQMLNPNSPPTILERIQSGRIGWAARTGLIFFVQAVELRQASTRSNGLHDRCRRQMIPGNPPTKRIYKGSAFVANFCI